MNKLLIGILLLLALIFGIGVYISLQSPVISQNSTIHIVAAENFYGDIAKQLGGPYVQVTSILSDPNIDPHQYESNVQDGIAINNASIVIENGDGYDTWIDKLLVSSPNTHRVVIIGSSIAIQKLTDNPHVWYSLDNIEAIAQNITNNLKYVDAIHSNTYDNNLHIFISSLLPIRSQMQKIKDSYAGIPVGLTETIFLFQSHPMNLQVVTPFSFEKAIAEGNDPSVDDVAKANDQISHKKISVLIYNKQTVTPITTNLQNEAQKLHIPLVPVTETMPAGNTYQSWMSTQLTNLQNALKQSK